MSIRFLVYLCIFPLAVILVGCGNKGELYLPLDQQLAQEFEAASEDSGQSDAQPEQDPQNKKKRPAVEPAQ